MIVEKLKKMLPEDKAVNYTVTAIIHFKDGTQNNGNLKIKGTDAEDAKKNAREKLMGIWNKGDKVKSIEFTKVKKG